MFVGYSVFYYGLTQIRGQNYGYLDLVLPGKWKTARLNPPGRDGNGDSGNTNADGTRADGSMVLNDITTPLTDGSSTAGVYSDQVNINGQTLTLLPDLRQGNQDSTGEGGYSDPLAGGTDTSTTGTHPTGYWNYGDHWGPPNEPGQIRYPDTPSPGPGYINDGGVWVRQ
jgi:hypothetical protein